MAKKYRLITYYRRSRGAIALGGSAIYQNMTNTPSSNNTSDNSVSTVNVQVNTDTTKAIKKISNTVVSVLNYQKSSSSNDFEKIFGGGDTSSNESNTPQLAGEGSGVIYKRMAIQHISSPTITLLKVLLP